MSAEEERFATYSRACEASKCIEAAQKGIQQYQEAQNDE